ncbi:EVE domain-containing protein [Clostridium tagluense]|uniref:HNH endonuclease n=1 Tax=Clostridium tagluense TaxID=360422 RepID=UPI001CF14D03|nr:HNH endonuclease [Clostridium tagluense]MCB2313232.1 EVE domain-containing protein [Clostridium tagluense]MCB2318017.1 EVE domain-containing protein [Clostridium tagluense]MCB2322786.1 EVE domain-containing protein [Clostridium tagluense]MCB2327801.1 EVE domain-containing protein [Clostridium tagluense]MCB2332448.1 EVE domain-containing protein [Clostridium tagluense]
MLNCWWIVSNEERNGFDSEIMKVGDIQQYRIYTGENKRKRNVFKYFSEIRIGDKVVLYKTDGKSARYITGLGIIIEQEKNDTITFKKMFHLDSRKTLWLDIIKTIDSLKHLEFLRLSQADIGAITISKIQHEEYSKILFELRKKNTIPDEFEINSTNITKDAFLDKLNQNVQDEQIKNLDDSPDRKETTVSRVIRDSELTKTLKKQHNHKCQICGEALALGKGIYYSEGHHIKPLGKPHNGPDIAENIIILCPNHHVLCDYFAIDLKPQYFEQNDLHAIVEEYIDYHNRIFKERRKNEEP